MIRYEKKNEIMKKDYENSSIDSSQSNTSNSNDIELEILYILDKKMRIIINKVNLLYSIQLKYFK